MIKNYLITDPSYYNSLHEFSEYLENIYLHHHIDYACFRDKQNLDITPYAKLFLKLSQKYNIEKTLLNGDFLLAYKLGFWGVHLRGDQFFKIELAKEKNLKIIISTHSQKEVEQAQNSNLYAITFSPIFSTPNKGRPKGVSTLKDIVKNYNIKCFALGGIISETEVSLCKKSGVYGFASIRYFINNC